MTLEFKTKPKGDVEMEVLFTIDDAEYTIPREVDGTLLVTYLRQIRELGQETAIANVLHTLIGPKALHALENLEGFTKNDFMQLLKAVQQKIGGALDEVTEGN